MFRDGAQTQCLVQGILIAKFSVAELRAFQPPLRHPENRDAHRRVANVLGEGQTFGCKLSFARTIARHGWHAQ
jgi:hypothetical protein